MQQQRSSNAPFQNRDSFIQRMHSNTSIDRFARRSISPPANHKISFVQAMDLQTPDRKSDLYMNVLGDHRRSSNYRRSSNVSRNDIFSQFSRQSSDHNQHPIQQEKTARYSNKHMHQCNCSNQQCLQEHCSCYLYPNQLCIMGLCCPNCVKLKNEFLSRQQQIQSTTGCLCKNIKCLKMYCSCYREGKKCNPNLCKCEGCQNDSNGLLDKRKKKLEIQMRKQQQPSNRHNFHFSFNQTKKPVDLSNYSFVNCSCKKSHCLKKYCSCFFNNKPCGQSCSCEDCHNRYDQHDHEQQATRKARYARHDEDDGLDEQQKNEDQIDQFLQKDEKSDSEQLPQHMQFEPVNFENIGR